MNRVLILELLINTVYNKNLVILTIGLEPIIPKGTDFESAVSTISPSEYKSLPSADFQTAHRR